MKLAGGAVSVISVGIGEPVGSGVAYGVSLGVGARVK